jgi:alcohol dehydrogenase class IV
MTESTEKPLSGLWKPVRLDSMYYGPSSVQKHLLSCLPSKASKAFIITGSSLANKTSLVKQVEELLGEKHHAGTFSNIKQHAPAEQIDEATEAVQKDPNVDTIISIGGGSPIDSAKAISYRTHEKTDKFLFHISIPTTLSAAECTFMAGFTKDGVKTSVRDPALAPLVIIYDAKFAA